jgi:hypothetical protein
MATLGHQIYQRMSALARFIPPDCQPLVADIEDQFARVTGVADGQVRYLQGVIEFYKARTDTKVTIAGERLALIAVLTLPITALSSIYGMNVIVNDRTHLGQLAVVLAIMVVMSVGLLRCSAGQLVVAGQRGGDAAGRVGCAIALQEEVQHRATLAPAAEPLRLDQRAPGRLAAPRRPPQHQLRVSVAASIAGQRGKEPVAPQ